MRWALLAVLAPAVLPCSGRTATFREITGNTVRLGHSQIDTTAAGWTITTADSFSSVKYVLDARKATISWEVRSDREQLNASAVMTDSGIRVRGVHKGHSYEKTVTPRGPWYQETMQPVGRWVVAAAAGDELRYCSVLATNGNVIEFAAVDKGPDTVTVDGAQIGCIHVRISLTGLLSWLWHGDFWFKADTGRFIRFEGANRPGGPRTVYELVQE